jgi:hypothetical protein
MRLISQLRLLMTDTAYAMTDISYGIERLLTISHGKRHEIIALPWAWEILSFSKPTFAWCPMSQHYDGLIMAAVISTAAQRVIHLDGIK